MITMVLIISLLGVIQVFSFFVLFHLFGDKVIRGDRKVPSVYFNLLRAALDMDKFILVSQYKMICATDGDILNCL